MTIKAYREAGEHLPDFLKDFHDQKDFFKAMFAAYQKELEDVLPAYNWRDNQIFCIDFFLWFLAGHGYKLQKSRKKNVPFWDVYETVKAHKDERLKAFAKIINNEMP